MTSVSKNGQRNLWLPTEKKTSEPKPLRTGAAVNRRELLKAIPGMYVNRRLASIMFKVGPSSKFIVFYNPMLMGPDFGKQFRADNPGSFAYPVDVPHGMTLDDAIRIYEQKDRPE